jgi:choline dehydrogenase-like flavoprotein
VSPFVVDVLQSYRIPHAKIMPAQAKTIQSMLVTPHYVEKVVTDFGRDLRDSLDASTSVTALLRACAVELLPAPGGSNVESVLVVDQKGQTHRVAAKRFVVAVGGLETARLFLNSTRFGGHGPGNRRGFVGSQFIDHATLRIGMFHPMRGAASAGVLGNTVKGPHGVQTRLTLAPSRQCDLGIGNHALELMADHASKKGMMQSPSHNVHLIVEQTPSTLCNVTVDPEKDLNCARLARVNWALSPEDMEGAKKFVAEMKRSLDPQYGTLEVDESVWESSDWRVCGHQMGTTRMALAAGEGVIDVNCRVFGTNNLFVAGGAVFPVGGNADPVVLILALARRLAKHLQG